MDLSKLHVVIVDDTGSKIREIRKVLERCGIRDVDDVRNQEELWKIIYGDVDNKKKPDLVITDMQYPLAAGSEVDLRAGHKLIERMEEEHIDIPVIICSEANYENPTGTSRGILLGGVLYREEEDCFFEFQKLLSRLKT